MTVIAFTTVQAERPLYQRDVLNAMAYPANWLLNLTYRGRWLDAETLKLIRSRKLKGRAILIVLCGEPTPGPDDQFQKIVPVRLGTILAATGTEDLDQENGIAFLRVKLAGRPGQQLLDVFQPASASGPPAPGLPSVPRPSGEGSFFLQTCPGFSFGEETSVGWDKHVERLKEIEAIKDSHWFRMIRVVEREPSFKAAQEPERVHDERLDTNLLRLAGGRLYEIEFYVDPGSLVAGETRPVELAVQGEHLDISEPLVKQYGSGATVSYLLAAKKQYASELVTVVARGPRPKPAPVSPTPPARLGPEIQMVFRIGPGRGFWLWVIVLVTLGSLGLNVDSAFLKALDVGKAEIWALAVKTAGSLVLALAGWFAFRRLPIKI